MSDQTTDRPDGIQPPPGGSGIVVQRGDGGARITLPRLYTRVDLVLTGVFAAVAVWVGAWLQQTTAPAGTGALAARGFVALIGLFFAGLAVSQAYAILAPRVIEGEDDTLVLARLIGVRRVLPRRIPKSAVRSVDWVWSEGEGASGDGEVRVRTDDDVYRLGKGLDVAALEWLEGAVRRLATP